MHFSRLVPLAVLACSHLVASQGLYSSTAVAQTGSAAATSTFATPTSSDVAASSSSSAPDSAGSSGTGTISDATNTTSTGDDDAGSSGINAPDSGPTVSPVPTINGTSTGDILSAGVSSGSAPSSMPSSNPVTTDTSAPSSVSSPESSSKPHHHDPDLHHDHGEKPEYSHLHHALNESVEYFERHKNRTGERIHLKLPEVEIVDVGKRDMVDIKGGLVEIGPETPESNPSPVVWRGHGPVVHERGANAIENQRAELYNETELVEHEKFNHTGKAHPHHKHEHHHNGTHHMPKDGENHEHEPKHNGTANEQKPGAVNTPVEPETDMPVAAREAHYKGLLPEHGDIPPGHKEVNYTDDGQKYNDDEQVKPKYGGVSGKPAPPNWIDLEEEAMHNRTAKV